MSEQEMTYTVIAPNGTTDFFYANSMYEAYLEAKDTYGEGIVIRPSWYDEWECGSQELAMRTGNGCWYDEQGNHYRMRLGRLVA